MANFKCGLAHSPITPFRRDNSIDYDTYAKVLDFHLKNGAESLALPMPEGEDLSLTDPEQRELIGSRSSRQRTCAVTRTLEKPEPRLRSTARSTRRSPALRARTLRRTSGTRTRDGGREIVSIGAAVKRRSSLHPARRERRHPVTSPMFMQLVDRSPTLRGRRRLRMDFVSWRRYCRRKLRKAYTTSSRAGHRCLPARSR